VKSMHKPVRSLVSTAILGVMASASVHAGGFSLYTEGSGYGVGNFGAGLAAEAANASTGWYNPAGLSLIQDEQIVSGGVVILPTLRSSGTSTFTTPLFSPFVQTFEGLKGGRDALVPSFHYARPLGEKATFGFSVVSPFGLSTEYGKDSPVRYAATLAELITINASPEIGGKLTENLSVGAGIDFQYARVKFNRMLGSPAAFSLINQPTFLDSESYNRGNSFGVGFHAGVLTMFNDNHTRIGLNYQSRMKHKFHGYSRLTGRLADPAMGDITAVFETNKLFSNQVEFPELVTLSGYQDVNEKIALLGSVVYTAWGSLDTVQLNNVAGPRENLVKSTSLFNYHNAWRGALGANYKYNEKLMIRAGVGYDETPTNDIDRDVRLPDGDRVALSVGGHYNYSPSFGFDVGYTYLFAPSDPRVNKTEAIGLSTYNVTAVSQAHAHLLGAQVVWHIDKPEVVVTK